MRWNNLSEIWQICFEQVWKAWLQGSVPIAALITNKQGQIISIARNHNHDDQSEPGEISQTILAHAEMNALLKIKPQRGMCHHYHIFTTCEPCPLCMSAIYMAGIRKVTYASHDYYAGSTNLLGATPYMTVKPVNASFAGIKPFENILAGLHTAFMLRRDPDPDQIVLRHWKIKLSKGVHLGQYLFSHGTLHELVKEKAPIHAIFNKLCEAEENL